jgi:nucleosome binding factor SPN SPT16 subunit
MAEKEVVLAPHRFLLNQAEGEESEGEVSEDLSADADASGDALDDLDGLKGEDLPEGIEEGFEEGPEVE